ncbi:gliding motility-associated C-terminal domain-containing protein [Bizionia echini]|uniref:Gliding motility-associated C-terminal domain-containing protein n=1 Tax=Bizionia echini TaxID=649333 RepID=A0A1I5CN70_9FLAO|nr:T9SS type B sorting domain-containing protein [Bizionia echini]SFN88428.1 gliding motility-associated C-terminal domain-containing protein [Bizionia echini]
MKKIIILICFLFIGTAYAQLVAIDDVVVGRSDNPNAATSTGNRIFLNDYFNGTALNFGTYGNFTFTETVPDPTGFITFNPLGFVNIAANTPQGIYYITYQICENANLTNCDTAVIEIRIFPGSVSSGSGSSEMSISASSGNVNCGGNVCITDPFCLDLNTGTIPPLTLSASFQEIGESNSYTVNTIPFNPPFSFGDTATGTSLTTDDNWSNIINFAFDFEFYQQNYSQCVLSTNGAVSFDLSNAGGGHFWTPAAGALIPNNTDAALRDGNIFGAIHDTDPSASGTLGTDFNITYSIKGEAPFRVFVFSFFNVAQFSSACNSLKTSQMIMFYETTNIVETYIFQKPVCPGWAGGRAAIGIQNNAGTQGISPPGRNTGVWDIPFTAPEAYQFVPNGPTITTFQWLAEDGTVLGTDPTNLTVTPSQTTTYVAQVTYTDALTTDVYTAFRPITVVVQPTPVVTVTASADVCDSGDAVFTISGSENDVVEYNINGGTTETVMLDATGIEVITLAGITTTQTINLLSANNLNSVCGGAVSLSATVTVNTTPSADSPADVTACNDYTLPALTVGEYYTATGGPGGTGILLNAGDIITATQTIYVYAETGTTPNCFDENSFVVTIDSCTLAVTATADMPTICNDAGADVTLTATPTPGTAVGTYSYSWTVQGDATVLGTNATLLLSPPPTATTTYEVTLTDDGLTPPNDTVTNTVTVTVNTTPMVDAPVDVTFCDTYTLPALVSGDYYTAANGGGTLLSAGDAITSTQTIYVYAETGTTPNCFDENSFVVTINDTPVIDNPADVTACDSYVLPALTGGQYYNGAGGTGGVIAAGTSINTSQTIYVYAETATTPNCFSENSFVVTINNTPAVDAPTDITVCNEYALPALVNGTYYTGPGGTGTVLNAGDLITTTQTIYVYAETGTAPNCFAENSFVATIDVCTISVTATADMPSICNDAGADVTLTANPSPGTAVGTYSYSWTEQGNATVLGTNSTLVLSPPPAATTTYEVTLTDSGLTAPNDSATNTVTVVVNTTPTVDAPTDVVACDSYVLPALVSGNYFTGPGGTGTTLNVGDTISTTQTIYVYGETATTPNCTDENSFVVTINNTPTIDAPADVSACDTYTLPALSSGTYYTGTGGTGMVLNAGDAITTTQTIFVFAETGTTPNCSAENSFVVTINTTPTVDAPLDVTVCDSYTLPALTNGTYYTGTGGTGTMLNAGDPITSTQTIFVYAETGTTPNCSAENSFVVTINNTPTADVIADVTACDSFTLPALTVGDYYTGTGGTGTVLNAGDAITTTQTIFIYAETGTVPNCTDESSFVVTINTTPTVDAPANVTECVSYTLPALVNGAYYTAAGGTGTVLNAGDVISSTQTIYVYAETGTTPNCFDENSFVVTINPLPNVVDPSPLIVCDDNVADGMTEMDLTTKNNQISGGNTNYVVTYYENLLDAQNGTPQVLPSATAYVGTDGQVLSVRVEDTITGCFDFTTLTLGVVDAPAVPNPAPLRYCDPDNDNLGVFDLTDTRNDIEALDPTFEVSFHLTQTDAENDINPQPDVFTNVAGQIVYIRVDYGSGTGCPTILQLQLIVDDTPEIELNPEPIVLCDDDGTADGMTEFDLTIRNTEILNGLSPLDYSVTYYTDQVGAETGVTAATYIATPAAFTNSDVPNQTIWVRVENNLTTCITITSLELIVNPLPTPVTTTDATLYPICDDSADNDGYAIFDLTNQDSVITGGNSSWTVNYFETMADVTANNPIPDYTAYANTSIGGAPHNPQTIFVTVSSTENGVDCYALSTLTLVVNTLPTPNDMLPDLELCDDNNTGDLEEVFDITVNEAAMLNDFNETVTYHTTMADAESGNNPIPNPTMYPNESPTQTIYVRVTKTGDPADPMDMGTGCYSIVTFDIIVNPLPDTPTSVEDIIACDDPFDNIYTFDLTQRESEILAGQSATDFNVTYYTTLAAAETGMGGIANPSAFPNTVNPQEIFVNIENRVTGCDIATVSFFVIVQEAAVANPDNNLLEFALCDDNMEFDNDPTNDSVGFDLESQNPFVLDGQDPVNFTVTYYTSQTDADLATNAIDTSVPFENSINPQVIFVRVDNDTTVDDICYDTTSMTLMVDPIPAFTLEDSYTLCVNTNGTEVVNSPILDTNLDPSLYTFEWTEAGAPATIIGTNASFEPTTEGIYTVLVTDVNNMCPSMLTTEVILSSPPNLVAEVTTQAFADNHVIVATATGDGSAIFEFSIDNGPWVSNTPNTNTYTFTDVSIGEHTIKARDINGCGEAIETVLVLDYPLFFTPNNDGDNDTWQISGATALQNVKIYIFDRYGKLVKQLNPNGPGWDGNYNGQPLPTSDYWFSIDYQESVDEGMKQFKAHFTLKR